MTATAGPPGPGSSPLGPRLRSLAADVLPPWLVARAIVLTALLLAHLVVDRTHPATHGVATRVREGLLGWDAGWYETIARHGYAALGEGSLRFFPLVPMVTRGLAVVPGVSDGTALLIVANVSSLVATAMLVVLVRRESGDRALARRTIWLLCLAPSAFTMVMGYAEATLLLWTVGCFLALRRPGGPRWWWVAATAFLAALTRPLGVLVILPIGVELVRWWARRRSPAEPGGADAFDGVGGASRSGAGGLGALVPGAVALLAPLAGLVTFLGWSASAFGDFWEPLRVQTRAGLHGGLADPVATLAHDASGVFHHHLGTALDVPWVLVALALLVVCWLRLPAPYSLFATGIVAAGLSGTNLDSFARYALSGFPLVWAGSLLTASRRVERVVLTVAAAGLTAYALLAFLNLVVP